MRKVFVKKLLEEMKMNKSNECNQLDVLDMIECIVKHLSEVIEGKYETCKDSIGFKHMFRGK